MLIRPLYHTLLFALSVVTFTSTSVYAKEPCTKLSTEAHEVWERHAGQALTLLDEENAAEAIDAFQQARVICDENLGVTFALGNAAASLEQCTVAEEAFDRTLALMRDGWEAPIPEDEVRERIQTALAACATPVAPPPPPKVTAEVDSEPQLLGPALVVGSGGALLLTGGALWLSAMAQAQDVVDSQCDATCEDLAAEVDALKSREFIGDMLVITGCVATAAGLVWLFMELNSEEDNQQVMSRPTVTVGEISSVGWTWQW